MKGISVFLGITISFAFSGCMHSANSVGSAIEKELGISVTIQSGKKDKCANQQAISLYREYTKLKKSQRLAVQNQLREKFRQITVLPTKTTQVISGQATYLDFEVYNNSCDASCDFSFPPGWEVPLRINFVDNNNSAYMARARKIIFDDTQKNGVDPVHRFEVSSNQELIIQTESARDEVIASYYETDNRAIYDLIESIDSPLFNQARQTGAVTLSRENALAGTVCGKLFHLEDLL